MGEENNKMKVPLDTQTLFALKQGGFIISGTGTLSSGTLVIENKIIKGSSIPFVTYKTFVNHGTLRAVATKGVLTVTSSSTNDASEFYYLVVI